MNNGPVLKLDSIDCAIVQELQSNARISFAELGRHVGLSTPAVIERVRQLEDSRVILGYRADVDCAKVGLPVKAFIKVTVAGDKLFSFADIARRVPEIIECHRVTGAESYIVQVAVEDVEHMEKVIDSLMPYVSTNTSLIMASPVHSRGVVPRCPPDARRASKPSKAVGSSDRRNGASSTKSQNRTQFARR
jgi:Lrp/AsnC family leucine-responsive transcriptional regulator